MVTFLRGAGGGTSLWRARVGLRHMEAISSRNGEKAAVGAVGATDRMLVAP